jgi:hypothetical protein
MRPIAALAAWAFLVRGLLTWSSLWSRCSSVSLEQAQGPWWLLHPRRVIGYTAPTLALFSAFGLRDHLDEGFVEFEANGSSAKEFLGRCRQRFWTRQRG